jgi:trk system potassium uptake protein TrkH
MSKIKPNAAKLQIAVTPIAVSGSAVQAWPFFRTSMSRARLTPLHRWDFVASRTSWWQRLTAPQLFVGSFALLILLGTIGLRTIPGLYTGPPLSWTDALFTATSAVCVTGLIVVDTATYFTPAGQAFLLLLIQLGGLGMIAFTSLIILALGGRLSLRHEALASAGTEAAVHVDPRRLAFDVVRFTFAIEAVGALLLYVLWLPQLGPRGAAWPAVFHAVSAFCNAGFSVFSDSLMAHQRSPLILLVIMVLIIGGGVGFLTLAESYLWYRARRRKQGFRVSLHTRIVLITTAALLLGGWLMYAVMEWNRTLRELPVAHRLTNSLFMSVTARTAGFNTVDYARTSESTLFLTNLLMMIGGSPGSTAGGIKTTTFALLGILAWSRLRGDEAASLWSRSLRKETTDRATGLFVIAFGMVTVGILVLTATERRGDGEFLDRMFEAVSAFNTVGLSTGQTPKLSTAGRWTIIALMFLGRVGPLTLAAALARPVAASARFRYAYEEVMVG